jgi:hypothetical protein
MASEVKTNKISPATSTTISVGDSGDTLALAVDAVTGLNVGSDAAGDVLYHDGTDYTRLAKPGTPAGEVLTFATSATAPSWVATAGGLSYAQQWRVSADFTISTTDLMVYQNWEKPAATEFPGSIGSDMVVDSTTSATLSGAWTFPEAGTWLVRWCMFNEGSGGSASLYANISVTDDNGASWVVGARNDSYGYHNQDNGVSVEYIVNIADVATDKVRFNGWSAAYSVIIRGRTDYNAHYATFMRLGDAS